MKSKDKNYHSPSFKNNLNSTDENILAAIIQLLNKGQMVREVRIPGKVTQKFKYATLMNLPDAS